MDIKDLNNQQLILLALLVSFITSIATGIVTVTLMDQAPPGVTQTINRVIEKTVQVVAPEVISTKEVVKETIIIKEEDLIIKAAEKNAENVVVLGVIQQDTFRLLKGEKEEDRKFFEILPGSGFILSPDGLLIVDARLVSDSTKIYAIKTLSGEIYRTRALTFDSENNIALLEIVPREESDGKLETLPVFPEISLADSDAIKVGQTAIALRLYNGISLLLGVVSQTEKAKKASVDGGRVVTRMYTTIEMSDVYSGSPLVDTDARLVGINIIGETGTYTVPVNTIKLMIDKYKNDKQSDKESAGGVASVETTF